MATLREAAETALRWFDAYKCLATDSAAEVREDLRAALVQPDGDVLSIPASQHDDLLKEHTKLHEEAITLRAMLDAIRRELDLSPGAPLLDGVRRYRLNHEEVIDERRLWRDRAEWVLSALKRGCDG